MSDFIGFDKQTTTGPATPPVVYFPVIATSQEPCHICGFIDERDRMHFVGSDDEGQALYICGAQHTV